jgi:hypothetical protein
MSLNYSTMPTRSIVELFLNDLLVTVHRRVTVNHKPRVSSTKAEKRDDAGGQLCILLAMPFERRLLGARGRWRCASRSTHTEYAHEERGMGACGKRHHEKSHAQTGSICAYDCKAGGPLVVVRILQQDPPQ